MNINKLIKKHKKVLELYPDHNKYIFMHMIAGGMIGKNGKYSIEILQQLLIEILNLFTIKNLSGLKEVFLLFSDDIRNYINDILDWILKHPYESVMKDIIT